LAFADTIEHEYEYAAEKCQKLSLEG